jgi:methylaspartate ammonia-lyase
MYIEKVLTAQGIAGYYNKDLAAIKAGARPDGFVFRDPPITPGFHAVTQPGEALSIMLLLSDRQVAFGDCVDVVFTGAAGRDPIFKASEQERFVIDPVAPLLQGKPLDRFRDLSELIDRVRISGRPLHTALRYGITQAVLDAVAKAKHLTITEIIASEYGCVPADRPIPLLACATNEQKINIDKMILKKVPILPHGSTSHLERDLGLKGEKLLDYARWLKTRIESLRSPDYHPTIHLDVYGTIGEAFQLHLPRMAEYLGRLEEACAPFSLMIETPIIAETQEKQIQMYRELVDLLRRKGLRAKVIADEWCNTLEDIRLFAEARAGDIIQIKPPDLGGIHNSIQAVLMCREKKMAAYIGGTVNGTDQSARISAQVALATRPEFLLAKPGQGVDEGVMIEYNEMQRTLTLIRNRSGK